MSKIDKKIISTILVMFILLSNFMPVISKAATAENVIKDPILAQQFYDENGDGAISKEEAQSQKWLTIKSEVKDLSGVEYATELYGISYEYGKNQLDFSPIVKENIEDFYITIMPGTTKVDLGFLAQFPNVTSLSLYSAEKVSVDLTGIEKHTNLEYLSLTNIDVSNLKSISKLTKLESLNMYLYSGNERTKLDLAGIENLTNIKSLSITLKDIANISNISKLANLEMLTLDGCTGLGNGNYLASNVKLSWLNLSTTDLTSIAFVEKLKELENIYFAGTKVTDVTPLTKASKLYNVSLPSNTKLEQIVSLIKFEDYKAYLGEKVRITPSIYGITYNNEWTYVSSNKNIATVTEEGMIEAVSLGEATITMTNKSDTSVKKTMKVTVKGIASNQSLGSKTQAKQISEDFILKANGELWRLQAKEAKAEKMDTNVKNYVYEFVYDEKGAAFNYTLTQKKDGTVEYVFNGVKTKLNNVKDIYCNGYLSNDGVYYTITEKGTWKKVTDNVEKLVGSFLVKKDGKTYTVTNKLVADFKIIDANNFYIVDENKAIWNVNYGTMQKVGEHFQEFLSDKVYKTTDGKTYEGTQEVNYEFNGYIDQDNHIIIDKSKNLLLNNTVILTNVVSAKLPVSYNNHPIQYIILRADGSTWALYLEGEPKLEKIIEQSKSVFIANDSVKAKPIDSFEEAITGFDIKKLDIASVSKNFNSAYKVKAYKKGKELSGKDKICTGSKIELYNAKGEIVKEYTALVYGDVTGSGNPSAADALAIIKNKTGKVKIENHLLLEAARVTEATRKSGGTPTATDALAIVKAKLGKYTISL